MSTRSNDERFKLPESLRIQLDALRSHLARVNIGQATFVSLSCVFASVIALFAIDRFSDTGALVRFVLFAISFGSLIAIPYIFLKWYWTTRTSYQLSQWLRQRDRSIGDRLMGVIELSESKGEQSRSPELVVAAMNQVAKATEKSDLNALVSKHYYHHVKKLAIAIAFCLGALTLAFPSGIANAILRMTMPWRSIPRYTFTSIDTLPVQLAVPFGEPFTIDARLKEAAGWIPKLGTADVSESTESSSAISSYTNQIASSLLHMAETGAYRFEFPGETTNKTIDFQIGDFRHRMEVIPTHRPEITTVEANVKLPEYLKQTKDQLTIDARRGSIDVLQGSNVRFVANANRTIAESELKQADAPKSVPVAIDNTMMTSSSITVGAATQSFEWTWKDTKGFSGKKPLSIEYVPTVDGPPQSILGGLASEQVLLNSEQINFSIESIDDFGVKSVGIEWEAYAPNENGSDPDAKSGAMVLHSGSPEEPVVNAIASIRPLDTFKDVSFESGVIELKAWSLDYFPDRPKSYSAPIKLLVLTPEQHSQWITSQLDQWQRLALDVRDRELQNFEKNKALHQSIRAGKVGGEISEALANQSKEETANAKRLEGLAKTGEKLLAAAAKNEAIAVGHLERWAEIQQAIQSLSKSKMPEVASLLEKASQETEKKDFALNTSESSQLPDSKNEDPATDPQESPETKAAQSPPKLSLPQTTLTGPPSNSKSGTEPVTRDNQPATTAEAISAQEKLLDEFNKLSDEMNSILGNLEASTFVKRLKAASRAQDKIANSLREGLAAGFSSSIDPQSDDSSVRRKAIELSLATSVDGSKESAVELTNIVDDMDAFFERRRTGSFRLVLNEIKDTKAVSAITQLATDIPLEQGMSVAQAEYWSDAIDRWAEELVDPANEGSCPGSKNSDSLPPSVVLDALRLLEGQVNLREQTRVADQRSKAIDQLERLEEGDRLAVAQETLDDKANDILNRINELPESATKFEKEIRMFEQIDGWMVDSANRLRKADTGREEMALQTEIIESLLKSKRINPKGGGGGSGGTPGGGGQGEAVDSALALLGIGTNFKEVRETREVEQSTGVSGNVLPEEYRKGLDKYFEQIERSRTTQEGNR
ncbi:MAG: hypothetical protein NTW52_17140 [Planctomycetota bacterium]|nr:hypothetical protein [Planctomycetota bacterium]